VDEHYLVGVVSLPGGVFNPYSGVKTSLLWFDRALARKTDQLLFVKVEADGFDLGAQRRPIAQNDLPAAYALMMDYKRALKEGVKWEAPEGWETKAVVVEREVIAKNGEYSLSGDRYGAAASVSNGEWPLVALQDVCDLITKGTTPTSVGFSFTETGVSFVKVESLTEAGSIIPEKLAHISDECNEALQRSQLKTGDVLFSIAGTLGRVGVVPESILPANTNQALAIIRPKAVLNSKFVMLCLTDSGVQTELYDKRSGVAQYNLSLKQIGETQIPLPPLSEQEALVAEVEGYQRVIDGARQVVAHYKPRITIDPQWEMVELGEVFSKVTDQVLPTLISELMVNYVALENITQGTGTIHGNTDVDPKSIKSAKTLFRKDDILYGKLRPNLNKVLLAGCDGICSTDIYVVRSHVKDALSGFFRYLFLSEHFNAEVMKGLKGAQLPRVGWDYFASIQIPLPPLAEQQRIVAELEEERRMVGAAKALAERMEARVKERVERVWSSGSSVAARPAAHSFGIAQPGTPADDQTKIASPPLVPSGNGHAAYAAPAVVPMAAEPSPVAERRGPGRPPKHAPATGQGRAAAAIHNWLQAHPGLHARSAILAGTGVAATAWNAAIKELLEAGQVERQGEKKGARYGFVRDL
ncbi:MAG: restriction endonuclease subunit S, partial [Bacteroidetes bacterium]|nr:restriction endonuclease subunit S [Bacteroidota bacterium]